MSPSRAVIVIFSLSGVMYVTCNLEPTETACKCVAPEIQTLFKSTRTLDPVLAYLELYVEELLREVRFSGLKGRYWLWVGSLLVVWESDLDLKKESGVRMKGRKECEGSDFVKGAIKRGYILRNIVIWQDRS